MKNRAWSEFRLTSLLKMESEMKVFVGKRNSDHYLAFDDNMNVYKIYGLYFQVGYFYNIPISSFIKEEPSQDQEFLELPVISTSSPFYQNNLDKPIIKLFYRTSSSSSPNSANPSSEGTEKGKQYQVFNYQKPFIETNPFECYPILAEESPLKEWAEKESVMRHTMLSMKSGCPPDKKNLDLFVGNLKITGRRELKKRERDENKDGKRIQNQLNIELQFDFWNDFVYNKGKITFWDVRDPIPPQTSALLDLGSEKIISFVGIYHLDSFVGQGGKTFTTVTFDTIWTLPFFIPTRAFLEFDALLSDNKKEITTVPQMATIAVDLKRLGKDWQGVYFPFILAGPNETVRITNTKVYQTTAQEDKMLMVLNQISQENGAEYEIEVWNGNVDNINPVFIGLKNGRFNFLIII